MSSVINDMKSSMGLGAVIGSMASAMVCGFCIGLPLALTGPQPLQCCFGGVFGGAACGAFLGGTAPLVIAKVREHLNKPQICKNAEIYQSDL